MKSFAASALTSLVVAAALCSASGAFAAGTPSVVGGLPKGSGNQIPLTIVVPNIT